MLGGIAILITVPMKRVTVFSGVPVFLRSWQGVVGAESLSRVGETKLCDRKYRRLRRPTFLLAVHFYAGVVRTALSVAKQVRNVLSYSHTFTFFPVWIGKA